MSTSLRFLGAAGYEIVGPRHRILVDPFLSGNPMAPCRHEDLAAPDAILVTHAAVDHFGDAAEIALRTGSPVVCGGDVRVHLMDRGIPAGQIQATVWGVVVRIGDLTVRPVECHHWSMAERPDGSILTGTPLAFIVEMESGVRIYHYGDTSIFDMQLLGRLYQPTVAILGCTQPVEIEDHGSAGHEVTGEMDPDEAALAAEMLGVDVAIASHYLSPNDDLVAFERRVAHHDTTGRREVLAPLPGDTVVVEATQDRPARARLKEPVPRGPEATDPAAAEGEAETGGEPGRLLR